MEYSCSICRTHFNSDNTIVSAKCGHVYDCKCINQWLNQSKTCPECRARVRRADLTKLFINHTFDSTRISIERSLDALKIELNAKKLEIEEKDKKFKELENSCAQSKINAEKLYQEKTKVEYDSLKLYMLYAKTVGKNIRLNCEVNMLRRENEILNTVIEGCSKDEKHILKCRGGHIDCLPTRRMATYCSALKRELGHLKEKNTKQKTELRRLKQRMRLIQVEKNKPIRRLKKKIQKLTDLNSSIHASLGSSSMSVKPNVSKIGSLGLSPKNSASLANMSFTNYLLKNQAMTFLKQQLNRPYDSISVPQMSASRLAKLFSHAQNRYINYSGGYGCVIMGTGTKK